MDQLVKKLIKIKENQAKLKSYSVNERGVRFEEIFGEKIFNIKQKEEEIVNSIIEGAFKDQVSIEAIYSIPEKYPEKETILSKTTSYLKEKESLRLLDIEITKEDKYRIICESAFEDGVLTNAEKEKLDWDATLLGLSEEKSNYILASVREKLELAKPSDFVLEIIKATKKISQEDIFNKITERPYSLDLNKLDLKTILQNLNDRIYFDENTIKYSLIEEVISRKNTNQGRNFQFGGTKYFYSIAELSLNNPYVSFNSFPQKQECQIIINKKNKYFNKNNLDLILREVVYDGIASHLISTVTATNLDPSKAFIDFKHKIGKTLNDTQI
tara:strand:+ start:805 stop:1788 length:984 start_codon:yes stop_codon:yes gene_type:complete